MRRRSLVLRTRGAIPAAVIAAALAGACGDSFAPTASGTNATAGVGGGGGPAPVCGNGAVEPGEACDDGNGKDEDGCSATCKKELCGDGALQKGLGEACDDGNGKDEDGCSATCKKELCGDGVLQKGLGEACDDGNGKDEDGCSANCKKEFCGDGVVQKGLGEECDNGMMKDGGGCHADCTKVKCGDGKLDPGEVCLSAVKLYPTQSIENVDLVAGDCDGDGDVDVIVGSKDGINGNLTALRNDGTGSFGNLAQAFGFAQPRLLEGGALDAAAGNDVAVAYGNVGYSDVYHFDPNCKAVLGDYYYTTYYKQGFVDPAVALALGDIDHDGKLDRAWLVGASLFWRTAALSGTTPFYAKENVLGGQPAALAVADVNGDSFDDAVWIDNQSPALKWLPGSVNGVLGGAPIPTAQTANLPNTFTRLRAADLDGDGDRDLVLVRGSKDTSSTAALAVALNDGKGGFTLGPLVPLEAPSKVALYLPALALGDVDDDGDVDAITTGAANPSPGWLSIFLNDGKGGLKLATKAAFPFVGQDLPLQLQDVPTAVRVADFNGDKALDVVVSHAYVDVANLTSHVSLLLANP